MAEQHEEQQAKEGITEEHTAAQALDSQLEAPAGVNAHAHSKTHMHTHLQQASQP